MISWSDEFSIGDSRLDADHKQIIVMLQQLQDTKGGNRKAKEIIDTLRAFADRHFSHEEEVMRNADYPHLSQHQDQHQTFREFIETLARLRDDDAGGSRPVSKATCDFLERWIAAHTLRADQDFGAFLKARKSDS